MLELLCETKLKPHNTIEITAISTQIRASEANQCMTPLSRCSHTGE